MAQLDITLHIYSDKSQNRQVGRIALYPGPTLNFDMWKCWDWAVEKGFTVYNPSIYDPRFKDEFKDAGKVISKNKLVSWLNNGYLSSSQLGVSKGFSLLRAYPDNYIFKIIFADWS